MFLTFEIFSCYVNYTEFVQNLKPRYFLESKIVIV